jgi:sulfate adenylyltransferase subunit 1
VVKKIEYKLDVNTLARKLLPVEVGLNDVVKATTRTAEPPSFDGYKKLPANGRAILIGSNQSYDSGAYIIQ